MTIHPKCDVWIEILLCRNAALNTCVSCPLDGTRNNAECIALIQAHLDGHPQLKDNMKFAGLYGRAPRGQKRTHTSTSDENVAPTTGEQPERPAVHHQLNDLDCSIMGTSLPASSSFPTATPQYYTSTPSMSQPITNGHPGTSHTVFPHGHEHHPFTPSPQHNLHIPGTHYHSTLHPYSYADHHPAPQWLVEHLPYNLH